MTTLTTVERTEERWAKRGANPISRYLNWVSLRHPWLWRVRLDLVVGFNLICAVLFTVATLGMFGSNPSVTVSAIITGAFMIATLIFPLVAAAYWIFSVTKSVRARPMPTLGRKPSMLFVALACCSFAFWIVAILAVGTNTSKLDAGSGGYYYGDEVPAEAPADPAYDPYAPADPAAAPADPAAAPAEPAPPTISDAERERLAIEEEAARSVYNEQVEARRTRASFSRVLFDRPVAPIWRESGGGFAALEAYARRTPPWNTRRDLFYDWRRPADLMFEPNLFDSFRRSNDYRAFLVRQYMIDTPWMNLAEESPAAARLADAYATGVRAKVQARLNRPGYTRYGEDDAVVGAYWDDFLNWVGYDATLSEEYARLSADVNAAYSVGENPAQASEAIRAFELRPESHARFQSSPNFRSFLQQNFALETAESLGEQYAAATGEVSASPAFQTYVERVERGADPSRGALVNDYVRNNSMSLPLVTFIAALCIIAILSTFTTGLNWGGLGVTMGSAVLAMFMMGLIFAIAAMISGFSGYIEGSGAYNEVTGEYVPYVYRLPFTLTLTIAGIVSVLLPLAFVIKDLLGGTLRRGSRLAALTTIWTGGVCIPIGALGLFSTGLFADGSSLASLFPNTLLAGIVLCGACLLLFALYATLIHMLIARIATYPQPG
jgi:hypothetical protein